ncbi:MAG: SPOR domain-containing protein [Gammaproteobacteria bacterium]|nr:SPOR domain-containing protein [Gammaproteobacteria bacterium]
MAKRRKRRKTRSKARTNQEYPGWAYGLFGLAIGLSVAAAVWVNDRRPNNTSIAAAREPASLDSALDDNNEQKSAAASAEPKKSRFDFYDVLPNFEVIIPEQEPDVAADIEPKAVVDPGVYVLQVGSFTAYVDADRRRAELALQGIESSIQRVTIDDKTYHRVRIGPTDDLDELNMLRSRLRAAEIDALRIRLGN